MISISGVASFVNIQDSFFGSEVKVCLGETAYTRVSSFIDWVESFVGDDYCV